MDCVRRRSVIVDVAWEGRLNAVRRHFLINAAAAEVIEYFIIGKQGYKFPLELTPLVGEIKLLAGSLDGIPLLEAEISAFLILSGDRSAENWVRLERASARGRRSSLALDRNVCRELERRMANM